MVLSVPGTTSAFADRTYGGLYLDINVNRRAAARYGLTTGDVQDVITTAIGGERIDDRRRGAGAISHQPSLRP